MTEAPRVIQPGNPALRPLERRVLRFVDDGVEHDEIARRFRRSPEFIGRVVEMAGLPGRQAAPAPNLVSEPLRPLERCILGWMDQGASSAAIAPRFGKSEDFVERVADLARYKLAAY
jgi:hypothetical protein